MTGSADNPLSGCTTMETTHPAAQGSARRRRWFLFGATLVLGLPLAGGLLAQQRLNQGRLAEAQKELLQIREEIRIVEAEIKALESRGKQEPEMVISECLIVQKLNEDPVYRKQRAKVARLDNVIEQQETWEHPIWPSPPPKGKSLRVYLMGHLEAEKLSMASREKEIRPIAVKELREQAGRDEEADRQGELRQLRDRLQSLKQTEALREAEVHRLSK